MSDSRIHEADETEVQEPRKRGLFRRGEDGLTTLEWLLIVAAVAGLAALAVVLVTNVVDQTAEQIGGSSARTTAARVAAASITEKARQDVPDFVGVQATNVTLWNATSGEYQSECNRLRITYGDVEGLSTEWVLTEVATAATATSATAWDAGLNDPDAKGCVVTVT